MACDVKPEHIFLKSQKLRFGTFFHMRDICCRGFKTILLPIAYFCARWDSSPDGDTLYTYSAFSIACLVLLFHRIYVPPALAYALTFLSLWWVDVTRALCRTLECDIPLSQFYVGVGGAGIRDALFLLPLMTAIAVAYGASRIVRRGERLALL